MAKQAQDIGLKPAPIAAPVAQDQPPVVQAIPAQDALDQIRGALGQNLVVYGDQKGYFDVSGETVASIREQLTEMYGIETDAKPIIDGENADEGTTLRAGQELEFLKDVGDKGAEKDTRTLDEAAEDYEKEWKKILKSKWAVGFKDRGHGHGDFGIIVKKGEKLVLECPNKMIADYLVALHNESL